MQQNNSFRRFKSLIIQLKYTAYSMHQFKSIIVFFLNINIKLSFFFVPHLITINKKASHEQKENKKQFQENRNKL